MIFPLALIFSSGFSVVQNSITFTEFSVYMLLSKNECLKIRSIRESNEKNKQDGMR